MEMEKEIEMDGNEARECVCVYVSQSNKSVKTKYIWLEVLQFWYFVMIGFISDLCIRLHKIRYIHLLLVCWLCFLSLLSNRLKLVAMIFCL